jgi:hypothetical protein
MMRLCISFLFSTAIFFQSYSQVREASENLKQQAGKMGSAFVSSDYKAFANYTYPLVLKSMGGASKMAATLAKTTNSMHAQGMNFSNITFDAPSKIVKSGKELQATIAQHTEIKLSQGRLITTSTLIAISTDNGSTWTFIDASNKDMATLRKALPNLSSTITIPPQQPPVRYSL